MAALVNDPFEAAKKLDVGESNFPLASLSAAIISPLADPS